MHYAVTNTGGLSPNVVQANAEVLYLVRAARNDQAAELFERVKNVARGAAMMTDCRLEIVFDKACSNLLENAVLNRVMYRHLQSIGTAGFDADDAALADAYQRQTLTAQDIETSSRSLSRRGAIRRRCSTGSIRTARQGRPICGSTDVGDVSWVTPTAQCHTSCYAFGTPPHSWQWVAQGKTPLAHKGCCWQRRRWPRPRSTCSARRTRLRRRRRNCSSGVAAGRTCARFRTMWRCRSAAERDVPPAARSRECRWRGQTDVDAFRQDASLVEHIGDALLIRERVARDGLDTESRAAKCERHRRLRNPHSFENSAAPLRFASSHRWTVVNSDTAASSTSALRCA